MVTSRIFTGAARVAAAQQQAPERFASSASSLLAASRLAGTGNQFSDVKEGKWHPRFKAETGSAASLPFKVPGQ